MLPDIRNPPNSDPDGFPTQRIVNVQNAFNHVNYNAFIGNQLSEFFGRATSAAAPRRVEVGFSLGF